MNGAITEANDAFLNIIKYTQEDAMGGNLRWDAITPSDYKLSDQRVIDELKRVGSFTSYEKEYICKDGSRVPVLLGGALFRGSCDEGVAFVVDLTERKHAEERIRYLAHHDGLTGLPNRILFGDRLNQTIIQAHRNQHTVAVIFVDLDNFKQINDSLGHDSGDTLLCRVGECLKACLRTGDSIARLGGDEFVICLSALKDNNDVIPVAAKVLEALRMPFHINGHELYVTGSIGISLYPENGLDVKTLMCAADTAMYYAKDNGRNNYQFFIPHLNDVMQRRLMISTLLHYALQRDEFVLHYQPQWDLQTGKIFSAEVLLRWNTPELGTIAPDEFIKVAEETASTIAVSLGSLPIPLMND